MSSPAKKTTVANRKETTEEPPAYWPAMLWWKKSHLPDGVTADDFDTVRLVAKLAEKRGKERALAVVQDNPMLKEQAELCLEHIDLIHGKKPPTKLPDKFHPAAEVVGSLLNESMKLIEGRDELINHPTADTHNVSRFVTKSGTDYRPLAVDNRKETASIYNHAEVLMRTLASPNKEDEGGLKEWTSDCVKATMKLTKALYPHRDVMSTLLDQADKKSKARIKAAKKKRGEDDDEADTKKKSKVVVEDDVVQSDDVEHQEQDEEKSMKRPRSDDDEEVHDVEDEEDEEAETKKSKVVVEEEDHVEDEDDEE